MKNAVFYDVTPYGFRMNVHHQGVNVSKRRFLQEPHEVSYQITTFFIVTDVTTEIETFAAVCCRQSATATGGTASFKFMMLQPTTCWLPEVHITSEPKS
jgi:hypothetical protein